MKVPPAPEYRHVASPLTAEMLAPLPEDSAGITIKKPLSADEYQQVAELLSRHPDKGLHAMQLEPRHGDAAPDSPIIDLGFLQYFPQLKRFSASLEYLESLDGIEHLQNAQDVNIYRVPRRLSAAPLAALTRLDRLHLQGDFNDRPALRQLTSLTNLYLVYAAKLGDLRFLPPNLRRFGMGRGSVTDISALTTLPHLQNVSFHKTALLADLSPLADVAALQTLYFAYLSQVTDLFDMSQLTNLTDLTVSYLPKLTDLRPVLTAPNLSQLTVYSLPGLVPGSWHDTCTGWLAQGKPPFWPQQ